MKRRTWDEIFRHRLGVELLDLDRGPEMRLSAAQRIHLIAARRVEGRWEAGLVARLCPGIASAFAVSRGGKPS